MANRPGLCWRGGGTGFTVWLPSILPIRDALWFYRTILTQIAACIKSHSLGDAGEWQIIPLGVIALLAKLMGDVCFGRQPDPVQVARRG